jgi:hypothetical protein
LADLLPPDAPLPPWLTEPRQLSPLLAAYDRRVEGLEGQLAARREAFESLQGQVRQQSFV